MKQTTDKMRDDFENWYFHECRKTSPSLHGTCTIDQFRDEWMRPEGDSYRVESAAWQWEAWQAKAAASDEEVRTLRLIIDLFMSLEHHSSSSMLPDLALHTIEQAKEKLAEMRPIEGADAVTAICEAYEQGYRHGTKSYAQSWISLEDNPHEVDGPQRPAWETGFIQGAGDRLHHGLQRPSEVDQYLLQAIRELEHCQRHKYEHCQIYVDIVDRANKHAHAQKLTEFAEKSERYAKANPDDLVAQLTADNQRQAADEAIKKLEDRYDDEPQEKPNEERT